MLFSFLKYLQPTSYFQLYKKTGNSIYPIPTALPTAIIPQLKRDDRFQSPQAQDYDMSWQAIKWGYIGNAACYTGVQQVPLKDNYYFIRKNFHKAWVFYVLVLRLLSLHNPIKEIKAWFRTRKTEQTQKSDKHITYVDWEDFKSPLLAENPLVSVIIPTLNRYDYLKYVLRDLEQQDYTNFEVIVVDQSDAFNKEFYKEFKLNIHLIKQKEKALWQARNTAIKNSKGDLIALSEDDVRIMPNWISTHLKCLDFFKAEVSAGVFYPEGQHIPQERSFFTIASQFATGNAMLYKQVFEKIGLFDKQFEKQRMGDGEFGMRVFLEGIMSVSNPYASCVDVKAATGGLRELGSWDAFRPSKLMSPRPIPSVLYYFRRYFGNRQAKLALLRTVPMSIFPYQFKRNKPLMVLGLFVTIILLPLVWYQVYRSWSLASKKINEGPKIDAL